MKEVFKSTEEAVKYVATVPPAQGATMQGVPFEKKDTVRLAFVGVGGRGHGLLGEMLACDGAKVVAVSDPSEANRVRAKERVEKAGQPTPAMEADWKKVCERDDVDIVYIASPWEFHTPQAVYAMEHGKHAAVEVPAATTLAECWKLVDTSERTRKHCVMLENCCYGQTELMALNMVRAGVFGTITHGEAAYIHELRGLLLSNAGEGMWRREPHKDRLGNLYPTHGLGPVAWYMNVHRGDRFTKLVSMSSLSAALDEYRDATVPADDPKRKEKYTCGDMNSSLIQTARGRTILLQHDVVTPRPYSRLNLIQGSKGTLCDYPPRVYIDGGHPGKHEWRPLDELKSQYEHSFWQKYGELAKKIGGHGGVDYIMNYRLVQTMREGLPPDMDCYDAAAWSAPGPLSDISVANGNLTLPFPDFTRGHWQESVAGKEWNHRLCDKISIVRIPAGTPEAK